MLLILLMCALRLLRHPRNERVVNSLTETVVHWIKRLNRIFPFYVVIRYLIGSINVRRRVWFRCIFRWENGINGPTWAWPFRSLVSAEPEPWAVGILVNWRSNLQESFTFSQLILKFSKYSLIYQCVQTNSLIPLFLCIVILPIMNYKLVYFKTVIFSLE